MDWIVKFESLFLFGNRRVQKGNTQLDAIETLFLQAIE